MQLIQYEKSLVKFDDCECEIYFFYNKKKLDGEWCWLWDNDKLTEQEALKKYPKNRYQWEEIKEDL